MVWRGDQLQGDWSFHVEDSEIDQIFAVLNPKKLQHLKQ